MSVGRNINLAQFSVASRISNEFENTTSGGV